MNEARLRTCTWNPLLRLFFFALAMIIRNVWAWLHLTKFCQRDGGRLILHLERLRFRDTLLYLRRFVEPALRIAQTIPAQLPTEQQLAEN